MFFFCFSRNNLQRRSATSYRVHRRRNQNLGHRVQGIDEIVSDARVQRVQSRVSIAGPELRLQREQHTAIRGHFEFP